ncbi:MAG: hypothetical protein ACRDKZ_06885 [Actinomycetota bacterium]
MEQVVWAAREGMSFSEFSREPILTVACVMLIGVAVAWVVLSRMIAHELKKAAQAGGRRPSKRGRRVWNEPPR